MSRTSRTLSSAIAATAAALLAGPVAAAPAAVGDLSMDLGPASCLQLTGLEGCTTARAIPGPGPGAISTDGATMYVTSLDGLSVFDRAADGTLTQKAGAAGCHTHVVEQGCSLARGQDNATAVVLSPDGENAYATSSFDDGIVVYDRAPDGTLTQKAGAAGCITRTGADGCTDGRLLDIAVDVAITPDGEHVYALAQGDMSDGITIYDRAADGTLTPKAGAAGCVEQTGQEGCTNGRNLLNPSRLALSPDGTDLYVTGPGISVFDVAADGTLTQKAGAAGCVNTSGGDGCATGRGLSIVGGLAFSADGTRAYAPAQGSSAITVFDRAAGGAITQRPQAAACLVDETAPAITNCTPARAMLAVKAPSLTPDGAQLFAATQTSHGVVVLDIGADGNPVQRAGDRGCLTQGGAGGCGTGRALTSANKTRMSPDGRQLYVGATGLVILRRQTEPDPPAEQPAPPAPSAPGPTAPAPQVPVALCNRPLTLLDVLGSSRGRVRISGIARTTFAGRRVVLRDGTRRVGSALVRADGRFSTTVKAPDRRRRAKVRYVAVLPDGTRSQAFKLSRAFRIVSRRATKNGVRVVVQLSGRRRSPTVRVQRQTSCTERRDVRSGRIDRRGRVTFVLPRPTDPADPVAIYRVRARINRQLSFTLQVAVERAG